MDDKQVISFDVEGKMAHFRKYYANNTALSFSIPPRTTLMGMIAAILGLSRDSYYEDLAPELWELGVAVCTPIKKTFHRLNLLRVESFSNRSLVDIRGGGGRIQTPFEVVIGLNLRHDFVRYRVFVRASATDELFISLKDKLRSRAPTYNLSLGTAQFNAWLSDYCQYEKAVLATSNEVVEMHSAVRSETVIELEFQRDTFDQEHFIEEELLPSSFISNYDREVSSMSRVLFSTSHYPIRARLNTQFYCLSKGATTRNVQFL